MICSRNLSSIINVQSLKFLTNFSRKYSVKTSSEVFLVDYKEKDYAILKLNKPPVNSLNLETLNKLNIQLDHFENDPKLKGIILTSVI